ncbi:hypothetical protein BPA30113_02804 [Burkholderia paludis]|uniref:Uncharacterized protein n=1 Tax=Burkholderia paludis TaxID=1506587 RepID=A0A6P2L1P9_9BURK|nr:hypothetical protein BPA30113_02804 [Burkholderia paludis]
MGAMRPLLVVELTPLLDEHPGVSAAAEPFAIQQFVAQLAIEAFDETVLPWATGRDEGRADRRVARPAHDTGSGKFRTVVRPDERRLAIQPHQPRQHQNHVLRAQAGADLDRQTFPSVFIDNAPHLQDPAVYQLIVDEVVTPDRIGPRRAGQANVAAAASATLAPSRDTQLQGSPQAAHPRFAQRQPGRDTSIPKARHFLRRCDQLLAQKPIFLRLSRFVGRHPAAQARVTACLAL